MDNVAVPTKDTTYYCKLFKVPHYNHTQHIVKYSMNIEEGHEGLIHHLIAYDCPQTLATYPDHETFKAECDDHSINMPSSQCTTSTILFAWAIGDDIDIYLPKDAGMPLSGTYGTHYILVKIHYNVKYLYNRLLNVQIIYTFI